MVYNKILLGDCYKLIKEIPDHSIDLIYTDIPYAFTGNGLNGGGGCFGTKKRDYHSEYTKVAENTEKSGLAKRKTRSSNDMQEIAYGIDLSILDEFVRVLKDIYIYIYGAVKNKYCRLWTFSLINTIVSTKSWFGAKQMQFQPLTEHIYQT